MNTPTILVVGDWTILRASWPVTTARKVARINLTTETKMTPDISRNSTTLIWAGRILSGLVVAFLLMDAAMKLVPAQPVIETMQTLGFDSTDTLARGLGILLLVCTALYAFPKTALLGALLLTGYLGGAIAIQLRAGNPLLSHILFGAYLGIFMWAGLLIRNDQIRSLLIR